MTQETLNKLLPINAYTTALEAHFEANGGEIDECAEALMQKIAEGEGAIVSLANYYRRIEGETAALSAKYEPLIAELKADIRAQEDRSEWIKARIAALLPHDQQIANGEVNIYFTESTAVEIVDADKLPIELVHVETVPDKKAIKAKLTEGEEVPGAVLKINHNLQIKHAGPRAAKNAATRAKAKAKKNVDLENTLGEGII